MQVDIRYFAVLRERRGVDRERVSTQAGTWAEFYRELAERYPLDLPLELVRFAVKGEFVPSNTPVTEGVEVALIPPVAGG